MKKVISLKKDEKLYTKSILTQSLQERTGKYAMQWVSHKH